MATKKRTLYAGAAYHVTVRGVDGRALFLDDAFRLRFLYHVANALDEHEVICDAYCLMTNHYHFLLRTPKEGLPQLMQCVDTWLAVNHNRRLARRGRVLEQPYHAVLVKEERHLLGVARYIPLNPVRAGIVADPADYEWSSFRATAGLARRPRLLTVDWLLARLRGPARYREFVDAGRTVRSLDEILLDPPA
jgi:REP element-mobilizing transposase RayT